MAAKVDTVKLIKLVQEHPILWDSREEDYKIAENKPSVWEKISGTLNCERCAYLVHAKYLGRID